MFSGCLIIKIKAACYLIIELITEIIELLT